MKRLMTWFGAVALALPATAGAVEVERVERSESDLQLFGIPVDSLNAGIGYNNWTGDAAPDIAPGFAWDLNVNLDVTQPVDLQVGYAGAVNSFTPEELDEFNLYTNEVTAAAQVQPVEISGFQPFVSGGIGLARASVAKNPQLNVEYQSDTMGSVPLAAGTDYKLSETIKIGARAHWDILFDNEIDTTQDTTDSDRWGFLINVGATQF